MGKSAIVAIKIVGDAADAVKALDGTQSAAGRMSGAMSAMTPAATAAFGAVAAGAGLAISAASDAEQALGGVKAVFGEYSSQIEQYSASAAQSVGLATTEYQNLATVLGSQLKNMGMPMSEVAGQTDQLVTLGADLAATFGGTTSEAVSALSSLLRGERDPIERYGVSINQAAVDAKVAEMGLSGLTGEAEKNANMQATLALLTEQTSAAQGQFAREADSTAGAQQRANAEFQNSLAVLGQQLLPTVTQFVTGLSDIAKWAGENTDLILILGGVIGGLAATILIINAALAAYNAIQAVSTALKWAENAAWLASPITWIVLGVIAAIALLVAAIVWVSQNWEQFSEVIASVWSAIIGWINDVIAKIRTGIGTALAWVQGVWQAAGNFISQVWEFYVINPIKRVISWVEGNLARAVMTAEATFGRVLSAIADGWQTVVDWIRNAYEWLQDLVSSAVPGWAKDLLGMSFAAELAVTPVMAGMASPLALTGVPRTLNLDAAPAATFASAPGAALLGGPVARDSSGPQVVNQITITVEGAVDPASTGRQIVKLLREYAGFTGHSEVVSL